MLLLFGMCTKSFKKTNKTICFLKSIYLSRYLLLQPLSLYLLLMAELVKGFLKVILQYKNEAPQLQKWTWHMHNKIV